MIKRKITEKNLRSVERESGVGSKQWYIENMGKEIERKKKPREKDSCRERKTLGLYLRDAVKLSSTENVTMREKRVWKKNLDFKASLVASTGERSY